MRPTRPALLLILYVLACRSEAAPARARLSGTAPDRAASLTGARFAASWPNGPAGEAALKLSSFHARVTTSPGTARTHVVLEVGNPGANDAQAQIRLPIPPGAAVTRAILWVAGKPMEGAFVERERAAQVYASIVNRRRDPALVVWNGPESVSVSIYPFAAGEIRRFELEWVEALGDVQGRTWYRVPVLGHEGRLVARPILTIDGRQTDESSGWIALGGKSSPTSSVVARSPGDPFSHWLVRSRDTVSDPALVVVTETSAAMTPTDRWRARDALDTTLASLPPRSRVTLVAADWGHELLAEGQSPEDVRHALDRLDAMATAGSMDLERALRTAREQAAKTGARAILFVGRGADSFAGDGLGGSLEEIRASGAAFIPLDAATLSATLIAAARNLGQTPMPADAALGALRASGWDTSPPAGAADVRWLPLPTVAQETVFLGRRFDDAPNELRGSPQDLGALWSRAVLAKASVGLEVTQKVLSPVTSLLVLESNADYQRFGIAAPQPYASRDRPQAKSKGEEGRGRMYTLDADVFARDSALGNETAGILGNLVGESGESAGVGGLGLSGTGSGSGGTGEPTIGSVGGRARTPDVIMGQAMVRGSLDKDVIRRVIRRHHNEVRYCYERELVKRPDLAGRVLVQFTIDATGRVVSSTLQSSSLGNDAVETCTVRAVGRWQFPGHMGGGLVTVSYPFAFTPTGLPLADDADRWTKALGREGKTEKELADLATFLDLPRTGRPEVLGWWIARAPHDPGSPGKKILAARLLRLGDRSRDALRILSEAAPTHPEMVEVELRRWKADADADRLKELQARR